MAVGSDSRHEGDIGTPNRTPRRTDSCTSMPVRLAGRGCPACCSSELRGLRARRRTAWSTGPFMAEDVRREPASRQVRGTSSAVRAGAKTAHGASACPIFSGCGRPSSRSPSKVPAAAQIARTGTDSAAEPSTSFPRRMTSAPRTLGARPSTSAPPGGRRFLRAGPISSMAIPAVGFLGLPHGWPTSTPRFRRGLG